jgi:hypothetical protein
MFIFGFNYSSYTAHISQVPGCGKNRKGNNEFKIFSVYGSNDCDSTAFKSTNIGVRRNGEALQCGKTVHLEVRRRRFGSPFTSYFTGGQSERC